MSYTFYSLRNNTSYFFTCKVRISKYNNSFSFLCFFYSSYYFSIYSKSTYCNHFRINSFLYRSNIVPSLYNNNFFYQNNTSFQNHFCKYFLL